TSPSEVRTGLALNDELTTKPQWPKRGAIRASPFVIPSPFVIRASSLPLFIQERKHQVAFGHDGVIYHATAARFRQPALPSFEQFGMNEKCVARENWFPKFYFVRTNEITDPVRTFRQSQQKNACHLCHRLHLKDAGHYRVPGKMPGKVRLVYRYCFHSGTFGLAFKAKDAVDHQKRVAMRQDFHHLVNVETAFSGWDCSPPRKRRNLGMLFHHRPRQLRIGSMSRFHGDDVTANTCPDQCEITDDVENLVPREFVGKTQRFFAQDSVSANDNRIFQTAAFNQILLHQLCDFFVINKRARGCDFAFIEAWRNVGGKELRESIVWARLSAGNPKLLIGQQDQERAAFRFDVNWLAHVKESPRRFLADRARFFD